MDTLYLQYLGIKTFVVGDGNFLLSDWKGRFIVEVDSSGNLVKKLTRNGRGPGEVEDVTSMTRRPNGGILVYDQMNRKVLIYDAELNFKKEFKTKPFHDGLSLGYYALKGEGKYVTTIGSSRWLRDNDAHRKVIVARYNSETGSYSHPHYYLSRPYARLLIDGQAAGGAAVPFSADQIIRYEPQKQRFWILWTPSGKIAEVNAQFDTLRTVDVNLPGQAINSAEIDSLKDHYQKQQWKTMRKKLPDRKVPIQNMRVDGQGRFWLKLSYRSRYEQWLVTSQKGKPQLIVQLPAGCILTHISRYHLGVRLNEHTFALYAPVK